MKIYILEVWTSEGSYVNVWGAYSLKDLAESAKERFCNAFPGSMAHIVEVTLDADLIQKGDSK